MPVFTNGRRCQRPPFGASSNSAQNPRMRKPGPPKRPTALALVLGNPGKRALPKNEPKPDVSSPKPPEYLPKIAKAEWRRVCPLLAAIGLMSSIDVHILAAYCACVADEQEAMTMQAGKPTVVTTHNGNFLQSPYISMIRQARADKVRYAYQLGMTPSARAGMDISVGSIQAKAVANDPASRFF